MGAKAWLPALVLGLGILAAGGVAAAGESTPSAGGDEPASGEAGSQGTLRTDLERLWFESVDAPIARRAVLVRKRALELGIEDQEAIARVLIQAPPSADPLAHHQLAVELAPDLPMAHMALARARLDEGELVAAITGALGGVAAIARHLEASVWLVGSLLVMFAAVLIAGSLTFIVVVGLSLFSHAAHDLGDVLSNELPRFARAAMLASLVLLPLVLGEGVIGFVLAMFAIGFAYGGQRHRMALLLAAVLAVIGIHPALNLAGTVLRALDADPVAAAALSVVRGTETPLEHERLSDAARSGDDLAGLVLAMRSRRSGRSQEASERYGALLRKNPRDAMSLAVLGNLAFEAGRNEEAIDYYERSLDLVEEPTVLFNLSQAYAKAFRMEEFELALRRAQNLDPDRVALLSRRGDTEFVADPPYGIGDIRLRMLRAADGSAFSRSTSAFLAPGLLGRDWLHIAAGFALTAMLATVVGSRYQHASRCGRCGSRICARCDDSMWSSDLCDGCHHLFHRPQGTDPNLRMARLQELRVREAKLDKLQSVVSMIVPGAAGMFARRPDLAFLGILFFAWAVLLFVWREGVVPDPLAVGGAGSLAFLIGSALMLLLYLAVLMAGILIRRGE